MRSSKFFLKVGILYTLIVFIVSCTSDSQKLSDHDYRKLENLDNYLGTPIINNNREDVSKVIYIKTRNTDFLVQGDSVKIIVDRKLIPLSLKQNIEAEVKTYKSSLRPVILLVRDGRLFKKEVKTSIPIKDGESYTLDLKTGLLR